MTTLLYGLKCEMDRQHGCYLVLSGEPPLTPDDVVLLEHKMLETYTVPRQLPIEFEEQNRKIRLRYETTSFIPLSEAVKQSRLSEQQFYTFLYTLVAALDDCKIYMLSEDRYVLKEEFIYIGQRHDDIHLLYLPLKQLSGKGSAQEDLVRLADYLAKHTYVEQSENWRKLQMLLSGGRFSLMELKSVLLEAMERQLLQESKPNEIELPAPQITENRKIDSPVVPEDDLNFGTERALSTSSGKLIVLLGTVFLIAVWAFYWTEPSEGLLYIGLGTSLLLVDGIYILHKMGRLSLTFRSNKHQEGKDATVGSESAADIMESFRSTALEPAVPGFSRTLSKESHWELRASSGMGAEREELTFSNVSPGGNTAADSNHSSTLTEQTTLLVPQDATVLLTPEGIEAISGPARPYLEVKREDETEKVPISDDVFRIGRSQEAVHYVEDTIGVSRIHLEISRSEEQEGYFVQDLGSKNGSYLNEERLIPYRKYAVQAEDRIKIATVEMIFKNPS